MLSRNVIEAKRTKREKEEDRERELAAGNPTQEFKKKKK
ncbi:unnamed protein product [Camellia sinensis]